MAVPDVTEPTVAPVPRWGMGDAAVGWVIAQVAAILGGTLILAAFGYTGDEAKPDNLPITMIALSYPPLWLGFVGVPVWASATKGYGIVKDFGARIKAIDVPIGIIAGTISQLLLVPLVSLPLLWLTSQDPDDLSKPARDLADKADSSWGIVLLVLIVVIGAPIAEELFFRGLVLRSVEKSIGTVWAVVISSIAFGLTHFEGIQTPALCAFGVVLALLVIRTGRLGTAVVAHMAFNGVSVIYLLHYR
jgi:membrane protease YdiL (CAAX protease family)